MDDKFLYKLVKGQTFGIVAQDCTANEYDPGLPEDVLLKLYRGMVEIRSFDSLYKLEEKYLPDPERVLRAAKEVMNY
jgi:hypothetical protein